MFDIKELDRTTFLKESLVIYQKRKGFRFGTDTFLLADFVRCQSGEHFIDLGTGSGVIPLLLLEKYENVTGAAIDVVKECVELARLNAEVNGFSDRLDVFCINVKNVRSCFPSEKFDVVVTNPPFKEVKRGLINPDNYKAIARHEIEGTLKDFIEAAAYLLRWKGRFYLVCPVERFVDTIFFCRSKNLEPKRLRFIQPSRDEKANLFLLEARKGGGKGIEVLPSLIIYEDKKNRVYTPEMRRKYEAFFEDK
ncbi:tRNA1(Val) (adenine(37)-N6)-methyltransferase [Desulfurobacterium indicum]|uniref:Methyltransferase n=1 Tax=Desulfurobacterium indicum TaxID=1914305 RepID=A0A1R1MLI7_9BACT|nr:tRNA1(Val) (adenine(37)-N6)-methyltransferase [Desulfurobacterium indicum]OMH40619.1 methyltransferase [Desulfurobacterium indicum]